MGVGNFGIAADWLLVLDEGSELAPDYILILAATGCTRVIPWAQITGFAVFPGLTEQRRNRAAATTSAASWPAGRVLSPSSRDLPVLPAMPPELLFCLAWFLISSGVFLPSDGAGLEARYRDRVTGGAPSRQSQERSR